MKRILWISRHALSIEQENGLKKILEDDIEIKTYDKTVTDVKLLLELAEDCDAVAAVLPIELLADLKNGMKDKLLLQSENRRRETGRMTTLPNGQVEKEYEFQHICWKKILKIEIVTEICDV